MRKIFEKIVEALVPAMGLLVGTGFALMIGLAFWIIQIFIAAKVLCWLGVAPICLFFK